MSWPQIAPTVEPIRSYWRASQLETSGQPSLGGSPLLLTLTEAHTALNISRWSLYELIRSKHLQTVKIGRRRYVAKAELLDFIRRASSTGSWL